MYRAQNYNLLHPTPLD